MKKDRTSGLLEKYMSGQLSEAERTEFFVLLCQPENKELEAVILETIEQEAQRPVWTTEEESTALFQKIIRTDKPDLVVASEEKTKPAPRIFMRKFWWAAASVVFLLGAAVYLWRPFKPADAPFVAVKKTPATPATNEVILTIADGSRMVLDSLQNGVIASQNGAAVVLSNGQLAYNNAGSLQTDVLYNTLQTPKGKQFQILLPDGSKVWLNAASSVRFPTAFTGAERTVEVSGEVYFEVAKNPAKPFVVNVSGKALVKVLGTHFNINAYENEDRIKTTLLEGRVQLRAAKDSQVNGLAGVILQPGQQAQLITGSNRKGDAGSGSSTITIVNDVDVDKVMAWKNGRFNFEGLHLREVMKQLEQWYDIDVKFEEEVPDIEFYGELNRSNTLGEMLDALKDADVHFRINGKDLTVLR